MWDELVNYEPIPVCRCGGCKCKISVILDKQREEEKPHQFLMGLDDRMYGTMGYTILSMEPLPNINRTSAFIIQEERHRNFARTQDDRSDVVGFSTHTGSGAQVVVVRAGEMADNRRHCGKTGHVATKSYQTIGYPEWWGD